jgi:hypothetical protein
MTEHFPAKEKRYPSKSEVTSLGQRSVALLGERGPSTVMGVFDDPRYGGLETHVAFFEPQDGVIVRVGTMQDWDGNAHRPDTHVVVLERDIDDGSEPADEVIKETTYDFTSSFSGYTVDVSEALVVYDEHGLPVRGSQVAGWIALRNLKFQKMPRKERRILRQILTMEFDRDRYLKLLSLISSCGSHNEIEPFLEEDDQDDEAG